MSQEPFPAGWPAVSICFLTLNGMPRVRECLDQVLGQDYPGAIEWVHIDSGSIDGTLDAARERGLTPTIIDAREFHHSRTRNEAADKATGEILVFLTQDAVPLDARWLRHLIAPFADGRVGGVYGRQVPPPEMGAVRAQALRDLYPDVHEVREITDGQPLNLGLFRFSNANCAVRADLCRQFRFPVDTLVCEDHGMCRDLLFNGWRVVYEPAAAVEHGHERRLHEELGWAVDNAISLRRMKILGDPRMGSETRYGIQRMLGQCAHFARRGRLLAAGHGLLVNGVRWVGVQAGKREEKLPRWLMHRLSPGLRREAARRA